MLRVRVGVVTGAARRSLSRFVGNLRFPSTPVLAADRLAFSVLLRIVLQERTDASVQRVGRASRGIKGGSKLVVVS